MLNIVAEACTSVPEDTLAQSFTGCGISNALDGSRQGDWHGGLADVGAGYEEARVVLSEMLQTFLWD